MNNHTMSRKVATQVVAVLLTSFIMRAQAAPSPQSSGPQKAVASTQNALGLGQGVDDPLKAAEQSLKDSGFVEGYNKSADRFVALGIGSLAEVAATPNATEMEEFANRRTAAFGIAMANAKQRLAEFVAAEISSSVKTAYSEPDVGAQQIAAVPGAARVKEQVDKVVAEPAKRAALLASDEFASAVKVVAVQEIGALQAFQSFEGVEAGGKSGTIVVIAMLSPNSKKMQSAMLGRGSAAKSESQGSVADWISTVEGQGRLMFTQGVVQRVNELGEVTLVAFSQASPRLNNRRSMDNAAGKATAQAQQMLRQFAGELVATDVSRTVGYSLKDFADGSQDYLDSSAFSSRVEAVARELALPGNARVKTKYDTYPATGLPIVTVAVEWNVSSALAANELKASLDRFAGSKGGSGIGGIQSKPAEKTPAGVDGKPLDSSKPTPPKRPASGAGATGSGG
jgi:hypothetical protein